MSLILRSKFPRGRGGRIAGCGERTDSNVLGLALGPGPLTSDTTKSPVRLALPAKVLETYLPRTLLSRSLHGRPIIRPADESDQGARISLGAHPPRSPPAQNPVAPPQCEELTTAAQDDE